MIFKNFTLSNLYGCIVPSSFFLKKRGKSIKIPKGTIIDTNIIKLLKLNNISQLFCIKLNPNEIYENQAAKQISINLTSNKLKSFKQRNFSTGRSNIVSKHNGVFYYDEKKLIKINSITNLVGIGALKPFSRVIEGQNLVTIKIMPYGISEKLVSKISSSIKDCFKLSPFKKCKIHLIQTFNNLTKLSHLDKIKLITEERMQKCNNKLSEEFRTLHDENSLNEIFKKSLNKLPDLILIFGIHAINDVRDLIPRIIKNNNGRIIRFGMPVEPGNLILLGSIKKNNKNILIIGMPGCAKSPKENGVDWVLWRILSGLEINKKVINKMSVGGLIL